MKYFYCLIAFVFAISLTGGAEKSGPVISDVQYSDVQLYSVKITWRTDSPSDSKVRWMISDSLNESVVYTDSVYNSSMDTIHSVTLNYLNVNTIYNFNVTSSNQYGSSTSENSVFITMSACEGWVKVYFNSTVDTTVKTSVKAEQLVNLEETLLNRISHSGFYIDAALSSFEDAAAITDALIRAKNDDVVIRVVYDGKQNSNWIDTLIAHGIPVLKRNYDTGSGHGMHMNFWIFDARCTCSGGLVYVWNSSAEITHQSLCIDKNSAVEVNDRALAYVYTREFDEMWGSHGDLPVVSLSKFGSQKKDNTPHIVNLNGITTEIYFAPSDSVEKRIRSLMSGTVSGIMFGAYDFKSQNLYNTLYDLRTSRQIKGIFDLVNSGTGIFNQIKNWADVWVDSTNGRLSHSYLLCDPLQNNQNTSLVMGSYDWTTASNLNNDEDIMIFHCPIITNQYYQEFHQRYKDVTGHPVGIGIISAETPDEFYLHQNYPNPFNAGTNIKFSINKTSPVSITVYNILGRKVAEPLNGRRGPGIYNLNFNAGHLSSGIYYYVMKAGDFVSVKKFVLIK